VNQIVSATNSSATVAGVGQTFVPASPRLSAYIEAARRDQSIRPVPAEVQDAAWKHIRATESLLQSASEAQMVAWLRLLAPAVKGAPTEPARIAEQGRAIWEQCRDLPSSVWCAETRISWGRRPKSGVFWPAAGELYEHLSAFANQIRDERAGCEKILNVAAQGSSAPAEQVKTPLEREAVTNLMAAWRTDMATARHNREQEAIAASPRTADRPKAIPLSDHELLRVHEHAAANGSGASAIRVQMLRQKLGMTEEAAHV
jgi:hypothetical protein